MCGNRVEELESRVKELEASVEGLTDELVECKVRLRELEDAVDEDLGFVSGSADESADIETTESTDEATKGEAANAEDNTEEAESDIIIA
jgi:uncharacterized coiled-coil protein SlyX